jgi:Mo-co oxidoreductase dimerisation domain
LKLNGPGIYPIEGFGWSGNGIIKAVDVTFDGGKAWREATLEEPILDRCLTRSAPFGSGGGGPAKIATRATDSTGYVQPSLAEIAKMRALTGLSNITTVFSGGRSVRAGRSRIRLRDLCVGALARPAIVGGPRHRRRAIRQARFGKPMAEADIAAWDIDTRTSD